MEQGDTAAYLTKVSRSNAIRQRVPRTVAQRVPAQAAEQSALPEKGLLILVNFADVSFQTSNTTAEMDSMLNGHNYSYGRSIGSARQYFHDQSSGRYDPHFDVVGPITLPQNMAYYGANADDTDIDLLLGDMVLHACSIAATLNGVNLNDYDHDEDGVLDFVFIIYAGYGEADSHNDNSIWPASWDMESAVYYGYTSLPTEAAPSAYSFGGKVIGSFAYASERRYDGQRNGIGTFCHEFCHVLGLPDYYDTLYGSNYKQYKTPGSWSLMDSGAYNCNGEVPPSLSPHDKWILGWDEPERLYQAGSYTLDSSSYYLAASRKVASPYTPALVYYFENRQQTGWDKGVPGHGLLIWKVKYNSQYWLYNEPNASASADGSPEANTRGLVSYTIQSATGNSSGIDSAADPFPGSLNVTSVTLHSYPIFAISEQLGADKRRTVSFTFMQDVATRLEDLPAAGEPVKIFRNGQFCIQQNNHIYTIFGQLIK